MLEQQDLKQIEVVVDRVVEKRLDDVLTIVNQGFSDVQKSIEAVHKRVDTLYSLVDGFIALHQKLDQELTMLRSKVDRLEARIQQLEMQHA